MTIFTHSEVSAAVEWARYLIRQGFTRRDAAIAASERTGVDTYCILHNMPLAR